MSVVSPTWLSLSGEANYLRSTYIDGFLDVSSSRGVLLRSDVSFGSRLIMSAIFPPLVGLNGTVSPNSTAATSSSWSNNGITWTSNASSTLDGGYENYKIFDNNSGSFWHSGTSVYVSTTGVANGAFSTLLYTNGSSGSTFAANGEWLQIQSSVPVTMKDFTWYPRSTNHNRLPKTFYLVGSNNGSTWTTIMYGTTTSTTGAANSATVTLSGLSSSGTISNFYSTTALTYTTYGNLTTSFTYFRLIVNAVCSPDNTVNMSGWNINFTPSTAITSAITLAPSTTQYGQLNLTGGLTTTLNVGIGTNNPQATLDVNGFTRLGGSSGFKFLSFSGTINGTNPVYFGTSPSVDSVIALLGTVKATNGIKVALNSTTDPSYKFRFFFNGQWQLDDIGGSLSGGSYKVIWIVID